MQRVTKYPLLLSRLYKVTPSHHSDKNDIKLAQDKIEAALEQMNKVRNNSFVACSTIQTRIIDYCNINMWSLISLGVCFVLYEMCKRCRTCFFLSYQIRKFLENHHETMQSGILHSFESFFRHFWTAFLVLLGPFRAIFGRFSLF